MNQLISCIDTDILTPEHSCFLHKSFHHDPVSQQKILHTIGIQR